MRKSLHRKSTRLVLVVHFTDLIDLFGQIHVLESIASDALVCFNEAMTNKLLRRHITSRLVRILSYCIEWTPSRYCIQADFRQCASVFAKFLLSTLSREEALWVQDGKVGISFNLYAWKASFDLQDALSSKTRSDYQIIDKLEVSLRGKEIFSTSSPSLIFFNSICSNQRYFWGAGCNKENRAFCAHQSPAFAQH